jgi:anti-sigma-K factor RskA
MTSDQLPDDDDILAAEYALGVLTGDDLATAQYRMSTDRGFAQAVTDWEIRLAALTDDLDAEAPGPAVKQALLAKVFPEPPRTPWWERLWVWQAVSAVSLIGLVVVLASGFGTGTRPGGPLYTAEIVTDARDFRVVAVVDKSTNEVILTRTAGAAPEGRILQVWAHGEGAPAISVGLWPEGTTARLPLPPTIASVDGVLTLGVSEEPPGGSPTGSPSGRVFGTVDIPGVTDAF